MQLGYKAGCWTCIQQPWETHLKIMVRLQASMLSSGGYTHGRWGVGQEGDTLQAWRMNKYWYYGELVSGNGRAGECLGTDLLLGDLVQGRHVPDRHALAARLVSQEVRGAAGGRLDL